MSLVYAIRGSSLFIPPCSSLHWYKETHKFSFSVCTPRQSLHPFLSFQSLFLVLVLVVWLIGFYYFVFLLVWWVYKKFTSLTLDSASIGFRHFELPAAVVLLLQVQRLSCFKWRVLFWRWKRLILSKMEF